MQFPRDAGKEIRLVATISAYNTRIRGIRTQKQTQRRKFSEDQWPSTGGKSMVESVPRTTKTATATATATAIRATTKANRKNGTTRSKVRNYRSGGAG